MPRKVFEFSRPIQKNFRLIPQTRSSYLSLTTKPSRRRNVVYYYSASRPTNSANNFAYSWDYFSRNYSAMSFGEEANTGMTNGAPSRGTGNYFHELIERWSSRETNTARGKLKTPREAFRYSHRGYPTVEPIPPVACFKVVSRRSFDFWIRIRERRGRSIAAPMAASLWRGAVYEYLRPL